MINRFTFNQESASLRRAVVIDGKIFFIAQTRLTTQTLEQGKRKRSDGKNFFPVLRNHSITDKAVPYGKQNAKYKIQFFITVLHFVFAFVAPYG